jgi:SH3-like domain-containing protein
MGISPAEQASVEMQSNAVWRLLRRPFILVPCLLNLVLVPMAGTAAEEARGAVTSLPLPRYVSLKAAEANARRGPSLDHRIDWVFRHRDLPLKVTAEFGNWRRVEDNEGQGGWVHYTLISGVRTVLFETDRAPLRSSPEPEADEVAEAETGVIGRLGECEHDWCRVSAGGERGWVLKSELWGVDPDELRE